MAQIENKSQIILLIEVAIQFVKDLKFWKLTKENIFLKKDQKIEDKK